MLCASRIMMLLMLCRTRLGSSVLLTFYNVATGDVAPTSTTAWNDLGAGCCAGKRGAALFNNYLGTLQQCKQKCLQFGNCGYFTYGWANSTWCTVLSVDNDCSKLLSGPTDCGSSGNNGVRTYEKGLTDVSSVCFLYGNSVEEIVQGRAQKAGPLKFTDNMSRQFTTDTGLVYNDVIHASTRGSCPNFGESLLTSIRFSNVSNKFINIFGYGPRNPDTAAAIYAPRDIPPRASEMVLITKSYAQGFADCSATMVEGPDVTSNRGPYTVGSGVASTIGLPNAQMTFTWTCDGAAVGTLTMPKDSFCGETAFLVAVVGKKGGVGITRPSVRLIQGRPCPIPDTTTTVITTSTSIAVDATTVLDDTTTVTTTMTTFLSTSTAGYSGQYRQDPIIGGSMRSVANAVNVVLFVAMVHLAR